MEAVKSSWRDHIAVHPAAEIFPLLNKEELRALAEDIRADGLKERVTTIIDPKTGKEVLLDGRNRLDALELLGIKLFEEDGSPANGYFGRCMVSGQNPASYVISLNIKRRHLTKQQQVHLIDKVLKATSGKDSINIIRSFSPTPGKRGGSTKDKHKAAVIEQAAMLGISEPTVRLALSKRNGQKKEQKESKAFRAAKKNFLALNNKDQTMFKTWINNYAKNPLS